VGPSWRILPVDRGHHPVVELEGDGDHCDPGAPGRVIRDPGETAIRA
jgi:hypothetical protein